VQAKEKACFIAAKRCSGAAIGIKTIFGNAVPVLRLQLTVITKNRLSGIFHWDGLKTGTTPKPGPGK